MRLYLEDVLATVDSGRYQLLCHNCHGLKHCEERLIDISGVFSDMSMRSDAMILTKKEKDMLRLWEIYSSQF